MCGVDSFNQSAKPKRIPNDSKAATAIRIPRKNKILGNSILLSEWCTGLTCPIILDLSELYFDP